MRARSRVIRDPALLRRDAEIVEEFTRVSSAADSIVIEVAKISWQGPHTPMTSWHAVTSLPPGSSPQAVTEARFALLAMRRFFRICRHCKERNPLGWMEEEGYCSSCGEKYYGVLH